MLRIIDAAALLVFTATAAMADAGNEITVAFGDLNLSRPADARILTERLQTAAKQVCENEVSGAYPTEFRTQRAVRECMTSTIDIAIARIESRLDKSVRASLAAAHDAPAPERIGLKD